MEVVDYNGTGRWSAESICQRYQEYVNRFKIKSPRELKVLEHKEGNRIWRESLMEQVIRGIKEGDSACVELGVEFVESLHKQPFGRILHSNTARALRQQSLSPGHVARLRRSILGMLVSGYVPHEYHQYAKLIRTIGLGPDWPKIRGAVEESNRYVMRWVRYFESIPTPEKS